MKFLKFSLYLLVSMLIIACGSDDSENGEEQKQETEEINTDGMSDLPLKEYGLDLVIKTPPISSSTGSILPSVHHEDGTLDWTIKIGDKFKMIIEEWSPEHQPAQKVSEEKKYISNLPFIIEYLEESENLIMYKRSLPEGQGGKPTYHVYSAQKINGVTYVFKSGMDGGHKPVIEDMVKTIKTVEPIEKAS